MTGGGSGCAVAGRGWWASGDVGWRVCGEGVAEGGWWVVVVDVVAVGKVRKRWGVAGEVDTVAVGGWRL